MIEKLIIKNFGPIKKVELDLGKFNVLIGDQGTGKSTVATLLFAINNYFNREILDIESKGYQNTQLNQFIKQLEIVGLKNFLNKNSYIKYLSQFGEFIFINNSIESKKNISIEKLIKYDFTYIPSERNLSIVLLDSLYAVIEANAPLPQLLIRFGNKFLSSRKDKTIFNYKDIISVDYLFKDNIDLIETNNSQRISIQDASDGIRSNIAMLVVFDNVISKNKNNWIVIEEPELGGFPLTQNKLVKHFIKSNKDNGQITNPFLLTTHSPYILTSLNNLMYAYQVGQYDYIKVNAVIDEKYWINPDEVKAYLMKNDGTCETIKETTDKVTLIKAELIDSVSRELNDEFDKLIEIENSING